MRKSLEVRYGVSYAGSPAEIRFAIRSLYAGVLVQTNFCGNRDTRVGTIPAGIFSRAEEGTVRCTIIVESDAPLLSRVCQRFSDEHAPALSYSSDGGDFAIAFSAAASALVECCGARGPALARRSETAESNFWRFSGVPRSTLMSTNPSCQPEKLENSQVKSRVRPLPQGCARNPEESVFQPERK